MKKKNLRLEAIKEIIINSRICSQEDLIKPLAAAGFKVTQATLSRDLKQLKIAKVPGNDGKYVYVLPKTDSIGKLMQNKTSDNLPQVGLGGFVSISFSGHIAVIKTSPGFAGSIAYDIDSGHSEEILGTLAGDDTVLAVLREDISYETAYNILAQYIPAMRTY